MGVTSKAWARSVASIGRHCGILAVASLLWTAPLAAQEMQPPPRHDARSPTGVSYHNGSFSFEEEDLSIGGGMPTGLSLGRSYNSSSNGYSYPFMASGWTSSLNIYIHSNKLARPPVQEGDLPPPFIIERCIYNLAGGPRSIGFYSDYDPPQPQYPETVAGCGANMPANYFPAAPSGDRLEFIGVQGTGHFRFTGADGSVIEFTPGPSPQALYWIMPDGTRLDFTYSGSVLKSVFSNRGWAILMESPSKACAVNLAQTYVTPSSPCPADAQTVTYGYAPGTNVPGINLLTWVSRAGATRSYGYAANDHVNCIVDPGQTACRIQNSYAQCTADPALGLSPGVIRLNDPVVSQVDASGRAYQYAFSQNFCPWAPAPDFRAFLGTVTQASESGVGGMVTSTAETFPTAQLASFRDPLDRLTAFTYDAPAFSYECCETEAGELTQAVYPEENSIEYLRDERGNVTTQIVRAKPNSGLADLVTTAWYPATCSNAYTCNKPEWVRDARNNTTAFTYWPDHGGVRSETGPPDANGIAPVKRYDYVQRRAWLKNASGGYAPSGWIWVLSTVKTCRISATVGEACAAGSADEVVTAYDYGPDSGPNNLLLRGQTVTATDGGVATTLRTCYGYDRDGRKISETSPNANLASCP